MIGEKSLHGLAGIEGAVKIADPANPRRLANAVPWSIAISREGGIEAEAIAEVLKERLGWPSYDKDLLRTIADEMGSSPEILKEFDERRRSALSEFVDSFGGAENVNEYGYFHNLVRVLKDLAAQGKRIFIGRGCSYILPARSTLRVLLVAPFEDRVEATRRRLGLTAEDAARHVRRIDSERRQFAKEFLNRELFDAAAYDLVLNPFRLGYEGAACIIQCAVGEAERQSVVEFAP